MHFIKDENSEATVVRWAEELQFFGIETFHICKLGYTPSIFVINPMQNGAPCAILDSATDSTNSHLLERKIRDTGNTFPNSLQFWLQYIQLSNE